MDGSIAVRSRKDLPYALVAASPLIDIWAFGVVFFNMCSQSGEPLFAVDRNDNFVDSQGLQDAALCSEEELKAKISTKVQNTLAVDLLCKVLRPLPSRRLQSMDEVLAHPYFADVDDDALSVTAPALGQSGNAADAMWSIDSELKDMKESHVQQLHLLNSRDKMERKVVEETIEIRSLSKEDAIQLAQTDFILRKIVFEPELHLRMAAPSCFVVLNQLIDGSKASDLNAQKERAHRWSTKIICLAKTIKEISTAQIKLQNDLGEVSAGIPGALSASSTAVSSSFPVLSDADVGRLVEAIKPLLEEEDLYLYLVDESTLSLNIPTKLIAGVNTMYPLKISDPKTTFPKLLPLMMVQPFLP
jgi:serine/threonine protein kinase